MTLHQRVPSDVDAEELSELLDDARAIPAAAFACDTDARVRLDGVPTQVAEVTIPADTLSIVEAAEHHWADFSR